MRFIALTVLVILTVIAVGLAFAQTQKPLSNDDVVQMVKAGFEESMIVKAIQANDTAFDASVQGLLALKNAGVSQKIIEAMLEAEAKKKATELAAKESAMPESKVSSADPKGLPEEIGVYVKVQGKLAEMEPEIVTWRTGGVLKGIATMGLTKGHINGKVKNAHSPLQLAPPLEFIIRCPEGTSAAEYQLLRLDEHGDRREFRAVTGGIIHASGGADRNAVAVEPEKVASRTYRIKINELNKGEYGFLPPGAYVSSSTASVGKIYTFRIVE